MAHTSKTLKKASVVGARLFAKKGFAATTTRELARALGITNGTFYHYFETKEDLLLQICNESLTNIIEHVGAAVENAATAPNKVEALIRAHVLAMLGDQDLHKTMLTELASLSGGRRAAVTARRDDYSRLVRVVLEGAQREGVIRDDISAHTLTLLLLNMLNWTIFWFDRRGELTAEGLADAMAATFIDGAAPR